MSRLLSLSIVCKLHGAIKQTRAGISDIGRRARRAEKLPERDDAMSGLNLFLESSLLSSRPSLSGCIASLALVFQYGRGRKGSGGWSRLHEAARENSHWRTA